MHPRTSPPERLAGYAALIEQYELSVIPNWHRSSVARGGPRRTVSAEGTVEQVYPARYWPGDSLGDQLAFALKYDGTNLGILVCLFRKVRVEDLLTFIRSKPNGKYARRIWFLFEFLMGERLDLDDLEQGNYVDLLDPEAYYCARSARRVRRQRINDNLLGTAAFCPTVRRTETLLEFEAAELAERCRDVLSSHPPELLRRALSYLYTKETRSSFEIEHEQPSSSRTERFVALLQQAERMDLCEKDLLLAAQNRIVDPRFRDADYRSSQNYVGETVSWRENVHYVSPKPEDLDGLMQGWIDAHRRMDEQCDSVVVHAAAIAYGFVFLHPFEDGNGRIHRLLIHNILARRGFTPEGIMFPVSAVMLKNPARYDASLDAFSRPLMALVDYDIDEQGRMSVHGETADRYRFIDMTPQAEALFGFIEETIRTELREELAFLASYDEAKHAIQEIVDLPDRKIDLFIRFCLQNRGHLSPRKYASHFEVLIADEVARMEQAVQAAYGGFPPDES